MIPHIHWCCPADHRTINLKPSQWALSRFFYVLMDGKYLEHVKEITLDLDDLNHSEALVNQIGEAGGMKYLREWQIFGRIEFFTDANAPDSEKILAQNMMEIPAAWVIPHELYVGEKDKSHLEIFALPV